MKKRQLPDYTKIIRILLVIAVLSILLLNRGFRNLVDNTIKIRKLKADIAKIRQDNAHLRDEIYSLQNDQNYIDYRIRKDLGYIKPGEVELRFEK